MKTTFLFLFLTFSLTAEQPNIVLMLADDMGFGEVQALNPKFGKIKTPHLDKVAKEGMTFLDAHSGSSVCTPTRYGLLTGRYAWRTRLQFGVVSGGESIIKKNDLTLAKMLKSKGYHTAMFGKWHLGMLFNGEHKGKKNMVEVGEIVTEGPLDTGGFDTFKGFHHAAQMDLWIEDDTVKRKIEAVDMLPDLTKAAVDYIASRKSNDQPFFLYVPWNSPHKPVAPSQEWEGKSGINKHADFVMQTDDSYGQVIQALKDTGKWKNTIVICTADNGTSYFASNQEPLQKAGHKSSAQYRGWKSDLYEGGHRVPFLLTWPNKVKPNSKTTDLICLTDLMSTIADIVNYSLKDKDAVDSLSFLKTLEGKNNNRTDIVHHSFYGFFAIRKGQWKLLFSNGSAGWSGPHHNGKKAKNAKKNSDRYQLFDMSKDEVEKHNLADKHPEIVEELSKLMFNQIKAGRSTKGETQQNDIDDIIVEKWKKKK